MSVHYFSHAYLAHKGDRVELHPATDLWMRGSRFGTVEKGASKYIHVRLDATNKVVKCWPENVGLILDD